MANRPVTIIAVALVLVAAGAGGYLVWRSNVAAPIVGVVRVTEIRVAPEVSGQLTSIKVRKGDRVRAGEVVAELSAIEISASAAQARAALDAAVANRDNVYAGVRAEEVASLAAEIAEAQANHAAAVAGPTREERAIADAQVKAAARAVAVLERHLDKTILRAPADGVVTVVVAEVGENIHPGQPVLAIEETGKRWLSFNAREDLLRGLTVGTKVDIARAGTRETTPAIVTELLPLGSFATWQAERAVGDHDRSTRRLRLDPQGAQTGFEPGMTVWLKR